MIKNGYIVMVGFIFFTVAVVCFFIYDIIMSKHNLEKMVIEQQQTIELQNTAIKQMNLLLLISQSQKSE